MFFFKSNNIHSGLARRCTQLECNDKRISQFSNTLKGVFPCEKSGLSHLPCKKDVYIIFIKNYGVSNSHIKSPSYKHLLNDFSFLNMCIMTKTNPKTFLIWIELFLLVGHFRNTKECFISPHLIQARKYWTVPGVSHLSSRRHSITIIAML